MQADILIKNARVVTMDGSMTLHEKADIAITGSKITDISPCTEYTAKKVIDASHMLAMPGLINTHTHAAMTLLRGIGDDMPLEKWLNELIFPLEKKYADAEFIRAGTSLAAIEMIKSGTTTFSDMYFFEEDAAQVCKKIGIRAFLGEAVFDFPSPDSKTPDEIFKRIEDLHKKWNNDPIIHATVAPHAAYTCSREVLEKSKCLADSLDVPLHTHLSETAGEVAEIQKKHHMSPVRYLDSIGYLCGRLTAVHCVHLDDEDIRLLKKHNVKVCHCQESNMKLASGSPPMVKLHKAGVTVGLGTDGAASNNNLDLVEEMATVAMFHKLHRNDPTVMDAATVLRMGTKNGAMVMQKDDIGSLETGKTADLILIDLKKPHLTPLHNVLSHMVYSANGSDVDTTIINGQIVMENRKLLTVDEDEVMRKAEEIGAKIRKGL